MFIRKRGEEAGKEGGSREIFESGNNLFIVVTIVAEVRPRLKRYLVMKFSIGALCINAIVQGQHCHPAVIEVIQEDFIKNARRNTIVDVLDDAEGVSEAGLVINMPFCSRIIGELKLQRMGCVIDVQEFLKNFGGMAMPPKHVRTQSNLLYSALEGGR